MGAMNVVALVIRRLKMATRTNGAQVDSACLLSVCTTFSAIASGAPVWLVVAAALFWPAVAFAFNLIDPMR